jgi:hypothetical protein
MAQPATESQAPIWFTSGHRQQDALFFVLFFMKLPAPTAGLCFPPHAAESYDTCAPASPFIR